jgi:hypothetical protein
MSINAIRNALRNEFGARHYRITKNGEIHVFGTMPNTDQDGWYLYGWIGDPGTIARIETL